MSTIDRYPGKLPVNYDSDNKPGGKILALVNLLANLGKHRYFISGLKSSWVEHNPRQAKPGKETFAIQELSFIDDPVNKVVVLKECFRSEEGFSKKRSTPKDKDVDALAIGGELSFVSDPFQLNSIALQAQNMRIPVPYTGSGDANVLARSRWRFL